jgi:crossover junction endodeoxyribonuclease RuvC
LGGQKALVLDVSILIFMGERIVLGIDPGTSVMGFGVLATNGGKVRVLEYGVVHLSTYRNHALKLQKIFNNVIELIDQYNPDEVALEAPFYGKNVQSMLKLGRAQGVAMAAALSREIAISEYAPRKIKQSITGNGNASKEQVAYMVTQMLSIEAVGLLDASDALAVGLCHIFQKGRGTTNSSASWKAFAKSNPGRVIV